MLRHGSSADHGRADQHALGGMASVGYRHRIAPGVLVGLFFRSAVIAGIVEGVSGGPSAAVDRA